MTKSKARTVRGKIKQISLCPHGLMEGFSLGDAFVKLPPHHDAEAELATLNIGDLVSVTGEAIATSPNLVLHHVAVTRRGKVVFDHHEIEKHDKPAKEPKRKRFDLTGKVLAVGTKKHGEIDRLLLTGNVSVHLHDLEPEVELGDELRVKGEGTVFPHGTFVRASSISAV